MARDLRIEATFDSDGVQVSSAHNEFGQELPDPVPMAPPVGFSAGPSLADFIRRTIQNEISRRAADEGFESFEEAEDFDIEDDPLDPHTQYEAVFDPPPPRDPAPVAPGAVSAGDPALTPANSKASGETSTGQGEVAPKASVSAAPAGAGPSVA